MKIIIAGDGKVGATLTRQLSAEGYDLTLIDSDPTVLNNSIEQYDVMGIIGNCATSSVLEQAGVTEADLLIAATSADELNLLCCMTAHTMNPDISTIARIRNPEYAEQIISMREQFGLSLTVNPERQAAVEIERLLEYPGFLKRDSFAKDRVEIVELRVEESSKLNGLSLSELDSILKCKVLVCVVLRQGNVIVPDGNLTLREGDHIYVTAPTANLTKLLQSLGIITRKIQKVMLAGGGRVSYYLAEKLLNAGMSVEIVEKDYARCVDLAQMLPRANVVHGDASNLSLLTAEGLEECDSLISLTGLDEVNIILSLYATEKGVSQVVTKLGHADNVGILDRLPIGSVVCPKELCCNTITRYVRAMRNQEGAAVSVHSIAGGRAEAVEFIVDDSVQFVDRPLKNIELRKNVRIVCITHGGDTVIPNGESRFQLGDTVIVVASSDTVLLQLNDIFA